MKRVFRQWFSGLLAMALVLALLPATAWAAGNFDGAGGGDGTSGSPYQISTAEQLRKLSEYVNAGNDCANMYFTLTGNIDLKGGPGEEWTPIGTHEEYPNESHGFKGTFDGSDHTISGLYIDSEGNNLGLFGFIDVGGTVKNLGVSGSVTGRITVGGIAGYIYNGTIENCHNDAAVTGDSTVGGIAGSIYGGEIKNCYNTGAIEGSGSGGIVSIMAGRVQDCYNTGTVSGTLAGGLVDQRMDGGSCKNCYNFGHVEGDDYIVGGITRNDRAGFENCYYLEGTAMWGWLGDDDHAGEKTADEFRTLAETLNSISEAGTPWVDDPFLGRPVLRDNREPWPISGDGSEDYPFEISNKEELENFRNYVNAGGDCTDKHFKLTHDINLGGSDTPWTPIGDESHPFKGSFDGGNFTVSGLYINRQDESGLGLFGAIGTDGTVKNLGVSGYIEGGSKTSEGGIAGNNYGNITGCHSACIIQNGDYSGGIAGSNEGTVTNCYNTGKIDSDNNASGIAGLNEDTVTNCYNTGEINGAGNVGGIAGWNDGETVTNCYNTGNITGGTNAGGIAGYNSSGTVTNCYNTGNISGKNIGGIIEDNDDTVTNCYYLVGTADKGIREGEGEATPKTAEEFASGEVAWLLQGKQEPQVWGQTVGNGTPELTQDKAKKVYKITGMVEEQAIVWYSNSSASLPDAPSKEGYTFAGWSTEKGGTEANFGKDFPVNADMTVYAVFTQTPTGGDTGGGDTDTGGGSGDAGTPFFYPVSVPRQPEHGAVAVPQTARPGQRVTFAVTPDAGYHFGSLAVSDRNGKPVEVTDNGDGTYTFTMPYGQVTVKAEFTKCGSLSFTDLDAGAWYHDYTDYVIAHGLMQGVDGGRFAPEGTVSRAQMVTVLWNMSGRPVVNYYMTYSDVSEGSWCAEAIRWAASEGIADGYGSGVFGPGDPITREQMAAMLYRYEQKHGGGFTGDWMYRLPFTDLDQISDWAFEAVAWCSMEGVITGRDNSVFAPEGFARRGELAAILTRYLTQDK